MAKVNYIVLHNAVDNYSLGDIIEGDLPGIDMDRLLEVGAIRKATADEVKVVEQADDPTLARGAPVPAEVAAERLEKAQPTDGKKA